MYIGLWYASKNGTRKLYLHGMLSNIKEPATSFTSLQILLYPLRSLVERGILDQREELRNLDPTIIKSNISTWKNAANSPTS